MKKIFILLFLIAPCIFAQQSNKGNISLVYNQENIDLPINSVSLQKGNGIVLSIKAEKQDSNNQQFILLEFGLKELSQEVFEGTKINIITRDFKNKSGKELAFGLDENNSDNNINPLETVHFGNYNQGEKVSWEINSVSLKIEITSVKYENGKLYVSGKFNGTFKSNAAPVDQIAELGDGEFEVIL